MKPQSEVCQRANYSKCSVKNEERVVQLECCLYSL